MMILNTPFQIPRGGAGRHVTDQLSAYLDYELPESERTAVREHLRRCPECENELATLRAAKQLLADVPVVRPPRSFVLSVEQADALKAHPVPRTALAAPQSHLPRLVLGLRLAASAVFVLALLLVGTDLLTSPVPTVSSLHAEQTNQGAPAAGRVASAPTAALGFASAAAAATSTTAPALAMGGAAAVSTPGPAGAADTATLSAAAPVPPPVPSAAAAANSAVASGPEAATSAAAAAAPAPTETAGAAAVASLAKQSPPTAESDQFNPLIAPQTATGIGAAPPPAPPSGRALHLLPWEVGLVLVALLLATASIFLPRQDS